MFTMIALIRNHFSINIIGALTAFTMSGYHLYTGFVGSPIPEVHYPLHVLFTLSVLYLSKISAEEWEGLKPLEKGYLLTLLILSLASSAYLFLNAEYVMNRMVMVDPLTPIETVLGTAMVLVIIESARRTIGWPIVIVCIIFLAYAFLGPYLPFGLSHRGYSLNALVEYLYLTNEGIFAAPVAVMASYVFHFVLFGTFLVASGAGSFFTEFANALTGRMSGGAAKTAIVSSALMGMLSGSSAGNVVTTGSFTIPAMKRNGYPAEFAAAVEAVASSGGQLTPPIMGAAAFIMAELTGISYITVIGAAIIPAFLYFAGVFIMVDLEAKRLRLGIKASDVPRLRQVLRKRGYLLIPVLVMLWLLIDGWSPTTAAVWAIFSLLILQLLFDKQNRRRFHLIMWQAMTEAPKVIAPVTLACAVGGILVGIISITGLGIRISSLILNVSAGHLVVTLLLTMIVGVILGMGMPTSGAYIILATLLAPGLVDAGVPMIAAHMFVLFSAAKSSITPPVAIASYAAAALAESDPWKTSQIAFKLGLSVFIIPFMYAYDISLLGQTDFLSVTLALSSALVGIFSLSMFCIGWFMVPLNWIERVVAGVAAITLLRVGLWSDLFGITLISIIILLAFLRKKRPKAVFQE